MGNLEASHFFFTKYLIPGIKETDQKMSASDSGTPFSNPNAKSTKSTKCCSSGSRGPNDIADAEGARDELIATTPPTNTNTNTSILSDKQRRRARQQHGIPDGGVWFWKQDDMLRHARACSGVAIAWDKQEDAGSNEKSKQKGKKM